MTSLTGINQRERLLTEGEVSEFLGVRPATLQSWRTSSRKQPLAYCKLGRLVRYRLEDVQAFMEASLTSSRTDG